MDNKHVVVIGATATGKSDLAIRYAQKNCCEIISIDSMQIYTGMEIGTGVVPEEQRYGVKHHMISIIEPTESFSVKQFQSVVYDIIDTKDIPFVLVGGTGLYTHAIVDGFEFSPTDSAIRQQVIDRYDLDESNPDPKQVEQAYSYLFEIDPDAAEKIDQLNVRRIIRALEPYEISRTRFSASGQGVQNFGEPHLNVTMIGLRYSREELRNRIALRVEKMFNSGWIEEVQNLKPIWNEMTAPARNAIGFTPIYDWINSGAGDVKIDDLKEIIINKTVQFSRRQRKWFERDPRILWIDCDDKTESEIEHEMDTLADMS